RQFAQAADNAASESAARLRGPPVRSSPTFSTVGAGDEKSVGSLKDVYRCPIYAARLAGQVGDDSEAGETISEAARDLVCDCNVERRQRSFAEPHQKNSRQQDRQNGNQDCNCHRHLAVVKIWIQTSDG